MGPVLLDPGDYITALGSYDGRVILVGSNVGRIFRLDPTIGEQSQMSIRNVGRVTRILVDASARPTLRAFAHAGNKVLRLIGGSTLGPGGGWEVLDPVATPDDPVFDIAVDWKAEPPLLIVATDTRVRISQDGRNWKDAHQGLPEVPYCAGLRVAGGYVFLSTWGRSMWYAALQKWAGSTCMAAYGDHPYIVQGPYLVRANPADGHWEVLADQDGKTDIWAGSTCMAAYGDHLYIIQGAYMVRTNPLDGSREVI